MDNEKIKKILIYTIWIFILGTGIYDLFKSPERSIMWFGGLILYILIYKKLKIKKEIYILALIPFLAHIFGELFFSLFHTSAVYDKILHITLPFFACLFFYQAFSSKIENKKILILFSVTLLLSFEVVWEIIEYTSDTYLGTLTSGVYQQISNSTIKKEVLSPLQDTILDMTFSLIGASTFAIIALFRVKNKKTFKQIRKASK